MGKAYRDLIREHAPRLGIAGSARAVLNCLADYADDDGVAYPSHGTIATDCGVTPRTVRSAIATLASAGAIAVIDGGRGRGNTYRYQICDPRSWVTKGEILAQKGESFSPFAEPDKRGNPCTKGEILAIKGENASNLSIYRNLIEPLCDPAEPEQTMISSQVFDRLADEWMVVNPTQQDQHLELANRYGFDAWLKGFDASKRGARSNASYVEKAIVSNLPDEEQWTEQRYFSPWGTVIYSVNCESAQVRFWDDLELAVDFPAWVAKLKGRELSDNFVSMLWMRAKEAKRAASR